MPEAGRLIAPIQSLLLKLGLLAIAAILVLWIGWTSEDRASIEPIESDLPQTQPPQTAPGPAQVRATKSPPAPGRPARTSLDRGTRVQTHVVKLDRLDLNRATLEQLQSLPGIGEALAQRVIDRRDAKGRFHRIDDLLEIKGIGPKRLEQLRPLLTIGAEAPKTKALPSQKPL
jgi:competence protein ComEA